MFDTRTPLGRGRAWLRLALMQKKLSDYMKTIINRKDLLRCVWLVFTEAKTLCEQMNVVSLVDHCSHNIYQLAVQSLIITMIMIYQVIALNFSRRQKHHKYEGKVQFTDFT